MTKYTIFSMSDGDDSKHYVIDTYNDAYGVAKPFESLEDAYIYAEQHCFAYRVNVDGVPYSVDKGITLVNDLRKVGRIKYS